MEAFPLPVARLTPPYTAFPRERAPAELGPDDLPPGAVFVVESEAPGSDWRILEEWVPRLRAAFPAVPVVLRVPATADPDAIHLAGRAAALRIRAVLVKGELPARVLRRTMCDPPDLAADVIEWLDHRRVLLTARVSLLIREMFRRAPPPRTVGDLLDSVGQHARTVRSWFREAGLPPPHDWLATASALRAALRLQREEEPLLEVALRSGYSDHSALSRQMYRLFGARPGEVRETVGWEWLMERWLRREGFPARPDASR